MSYHPNPVREIIASSYGGPEKLYALADVVLSALTEAGYRVVLDETKVKWTEESGRAPATLIPNPNPQAGFPTSRPPVDVGAPKEQT